MIETGPQEAAAAAWGALTEAVERSKHIAPTGDAEIDRAVQLAHLKAISRLGVKHITAVDAMREALGG
jgi:hypothetical protein